MTFLLSLLMLLQPPGEYVVLRVDGIVVVKGRTDTLKRGQKLNDADSIRFLQPGSSVTVLSPQKGRIQLTARTDARGKISRPNELFHLVRSSMIPSTTQIIMAGRDGVLTNELQFARWLERTASLDTALLVIDSMKINLGPYFFERRNSHFFMARYKYKNEEINKKLSTVTEADGSFSLKIDAKIFTVDGKATGLSHISKVQWYYYDETTQKAVLLGQSALWIVPLSAVQQEVCLIRQNMDETLSDEGNTASEIYGYLKDYYGATNTQTIRRLQTELQCK